MHRWLLQCLHGYVWFFSFSLSDCNLEKIKGTVKNACQWNGTLPFAINCIYFKIFFDFLSEICMTFFVQKLVLLKLLLHTFKWTVVWDVFLLFSKVGFGTKIFMIHTLIIHYNSRCDGLAWKHLMRLSSLHTNFCYRLLGDGSGSETSTSDRAQLSIKFSSPSRSAVQQIWDHCQALQ